MYQTDINPSYHNSVNFTDNQLLYLPCVKDKFQFMELCEGCIECAKACPHDSVTFVATEPGVRYPFINPEVSPCYLCDDLPCADVCPSGALERIPQSQIKMGKAMLDPMHCLCLYQECRICFDSCPLSGSAIIWDDEVNAPLINLKFCVGCGVCVHVCPSDGKPLMIFPS